MSNQPQQSQQIYLPITIGSPITQLSGNENAAPAPEQNRIDINIPPSNYSPIELFQQGNTDFASPDRMSPSNVPPPFFKGEIVPKYNVNSEQLLDLASEMAKAGKADVAEKLLNQALEADQSLSKSGRFHMTNLAGDTMDETNPLIKALAKNGASPSPTTYKINETLLQLGAYTGIKEPQEASNLTFAFLRAIARIPLIDSIIRTRQFQVTRFAKLPEHSRDTGFAIKMRDRRAIVTPAARKQIEQFENMILHGGYTKLPDGSRRTHPITGEPGVWDGNGQEKAAGFRDFLATIVRDSLSMDWACYRIEPGVDKKKFPIAFFSPVDSAMIRRTVWQQYEPKIEKTGTPIHYIEYSPARNGEPIREYTWDRMASIVRNPRRDFWGIGYGLSEIEIILELVCSMVMGMRYQSEYFSNNHIPPGVLSITGSPMGTSDHAIAKLREQVMSSVGGANGFWKMIYLLFPAGAGQGVSYTPLRGSSGGASEMPALSGYTQSLQALICAVFCITLEEIGLPSQSSGRPLIGGNGPEAAIENSQDKGRKPIMESVAASMNEDLIERIDPDFVFGWVNNDVSDIEADLTTAQAYMGLGWTANKLCDEMDVERENHALDSALWNQCSKKVKEKDNESPSEWKSRVDELYEKEAKKKGLLVVWSQAWDVPAGNPGMMQVYMQELQMNQQVAQQQMQTNQQMQQMGLDPDNEKDVQKFQQLQAQQQQNQMQGGNPNEDDPNAQMQGFNGAPVNPDKSSSQDGPSNGWGDGSPTPEALDGPDDYDESDEDEDEDSKDDDSQEDDNEDEEENDDYDTPRKPKKPMGNPPSGAFGKSLKSIEEKANIVKSGKHKLVFSKKNAKKKPLPIPADLPTLKSLNIPKPETVEQKRVYEIHLKI